MGVVSSFSYRRWPIAAYGRNLLCPSFPFLEGGGEFFVFLFPCEEFLFFCVFPFFVRDFRGSVRLENPISFFEVSFAFPKKKF